MCAAAAAMRSSGVVCPIALIAGDGACNVGGAGDLEALKVHVWKGLGPLQATRIGSMIEGECVINDIMLEITHAWLLACLVAGH